MGKSLDSFLPLVKYRVTPDEAEYLQTLQLTCSVDEEIGQNSNTAHIIFLVAEMVEYLSRFNALKPGDLILTGTPESVIMG